MSDVRTRNSEFGPSNTSPESAEATKSKDGLSYLVIQASWKGPNAGTGWLQFDQGAEWPSGMG